MNDETKTADPELDESEAAAELDDAPLTLDDNEAATETADAARARFFWYEVGCRGSLPRLTADTRPLEEIEAALAAARGETLREAVKGAIEMFESIARVSASTDSNPRPLLPSLVTEARGALQRALTDRPMLRMSGLPGSATAAAIFAADEVTFVRYVLAQEVPAELDDDDAPPPPPRQARPQLPQRALPTPVAAPPKKGKPGGGMRV